MKVSLEGLFSNIDRDLRSGDRTNAGNYGAALWELRAHLIELVAGSVTVEQFAAHYCLPGPVAGGALAVPTDLDKAFEEFKSIYKPLGFRNDWMAAKRKFEQLVRKLRVKPEEIIAGTRAYAATNPDRQYVPAPNGFLHRRQFAYDWTQAVPEPPRGPRGPSLYDIEQHFADKIGDR